MRLLYSITFSVLLLLPSVGLQVDVILCCGNLDSFAIADQIDIGKSDCCADEDESSGCMDYFYLDKAPEKLDFSSSQDLSVNAADIPASSPSRSSFIARSPSRDSYLANLHPISPVILYQVFRC